MFTVRHCPALTDVNKSSREAKAGRVKNKMNRISNLPMVMAKGGQLDRME